MEELAGLALLLQSGLQSRTPDVQGTHSFASQRSTILVPDTELSILIQCWIMHLACCYFQAQSSVYLCGDLLHTPCLHTDGLTGPVLNTGLEYGGQVEDSQLMYLLRCWVA